MKIGIVLHPYGEKYPAGLARIIFEWTKALVASDMKNEYTIFTKERSVPADVFSGGRLRAAALGGGRFWLDRGLSRMREADVIIFNTPVLPFFGKPKRSIVIALDFAYQYIPAYSLVDWAKKFTLKWYHGYSLRRADAVIAISDATKNDCARLYGIPKGKITVIHPGFTDICALPQKPVDVPKPFFLFIGALKERKNVHGVIGAFAEYRRRNPASREMLCIAGSGAGEYRGSLRMLAEKEGISPHICFLGPVSDRELSFLYKNTVALVFPSFIEGFGFPILEAMACGTPVITSRGSSSEEIARDAALLVDPKNINEIAGAMQKITNDGSLRDSLVRAGNGRVAQFSWSKAAKELLKVIENTR